MMAHSQKEHQQCPHLLSTKTLPTIKDCGIITSSEIVRILGSSFGDDAGSYAKTELQQGAPRGERVQKLLYF